MPSVAMNGGMFIRLTSVPETRPQKAPIPIAPSTPSGNGRPQKVRMTPAVTAQNVISVPIDRSMPPVMMIMVTPIASTPLTAVAWRIARMFEV